MMLSPESYLNKIITSLGLQTKAGKEPYVMNSYTTSPVKIHDVEVSVSFVHYSKGGIRIEVHFELPDTAVTANAYIKHVAEVEKLRKNHEGRPSSGPKYRDWSSSLSQKDTDAYSPWNNQFFCVDAMNYNDSEVDEAVDSVITLAKPFIDHLGDIAKLRRWQVTDPEVIAKAKEIIANADLYETDVDREEKAHYLRDRNSFFHGWFSPFNDRGRGTFDTLWPSSVDYAASGMGLKGSFEYAVACILLEDRDFIAKGREACHIREETIVRQY